MFYVNLAQQDAWKPHVWHRVQQLARDCPELYSNLPAQVKAAMTAPTPASNPNKPPQ